MIIKLSKRGFALSLFLFLGSLLVLVAFEFLVISGYFVDPAVFLGEIRAVIVILVVSFLTHFTTRFIREKNSRKKIQLVFVYLPSIVFISLLAFLNLNVSGVFSGVWGFSYGAGLLFYLFGICIFGMAVFNVALWIKKYIAIEDRVEKKQIRIFFIALGAFLIGMLLLDVIFPVAGFSVKPFVFLAVLLMTGLIVYDVFKYDFMFKVGTYFSKIKFRIMIPVSIFIASLIIILGASVYLFFHSRLEDELIDRFKVATESGVGQVIGFLGDKSEQLEILAKDHHFSDKLLEDYGIFEVHGEVRDDKLDHYYDVIDIFKQEDFVELFVLDKYGKVSLSSNKENIGLDKSNDHYFSEGMRGLFVDSDHYGDVVDSRVVIPIATPIHYDIYGEGEEVVGVLVALVDKSEIDNILLGLSELSESRETSKSFIIDSEYRLVTPYEEDQLDYLGKKVETGLTMSCFGDVGDTSFRGEGIIGTHFYSSELEWCFVSEVEQDEIFSSVHQILRFITFIGVSALVVSYFIINWIAKKITNPIEELEKGVEIVAGGNLEYKVGMTGDNEISRLSRKFDDMNEIIYKFKGAIEEKVDVQTLDIRKKRDRLERQQKAILNILEDVEKEKIKSENLAHDLKRFKLAVDNASDHIIITDIDGVILYANQSTERITGFDAENILGQKAGTKENWGGMMEADFYADMWNTLRTEKGVFVGEMTNKRRGGEEYDVSVSISPITNNSGEIIFFVAIERDITKEKQIDRAKTEFVSLASHQLRTPLSAINWYAEMLLDEDAGKLTKKQRAYMDEIYKGNQRMIELVGALLNVSRIELGTFSIDPEPVSLIDISDSVIGELEPLINEKNISILRDYDETIGAVNLDRKLTTIVFQNLISNSVKYTPELGKVVISINRRKDDIMIVVADTGYGIPVSQQSKIFTKLFRADNVLEKETDGTGLGLYIVKAIIEEIGGKIWFSSEEGKGTIFYITIPVEGVKKKNGVKRLT
ncbi:ATP-binding protein [Patescibacteria group bacterium]